MEDTSAKRRKLAFYKCTFCRTAKKKCLPSEREWPEKCARCQTKGLECSMPQRVDQYRAGSHEPSEVTSPDGGFLRMNEDGTASTISDPEPRRAPLAQMGSAYGAVPGAGRSPLSGLRTHSIDHAIPRGQDRTGQQPVPPHWQSPRTFVWRDRTEHYRYNRLRSGEIRIAHLLAGNFGDSVVVEISSERLDNNIQGYHALSWHWGGSNDEADQDIRIKDRNSESTWILAVKHNLWAGLKRLRQPNRPIRLWVDALCIDQLEPKYDVEEFMIKNLEKSEQICLMSDIYTHADEVTVWIGEPASKGEDVRKALAFVERTVNLDDENNVAGLGKMAFDQNTMHELECFIKLLQRPWFSRRWVVQEIVLARSARVHYGDQSIDWTKLADAISLLENIGRDGSIQRMLNQKMANSSRTPEDIGSISSLPAYRLVQNTTQMSNGQERDKLKFRLYSLEQLVSFLAAFRASRLHDTIYAVLGISSDFRPVPASPSSFADDQFRLARVLGGGGSTNDNWIDNGGRKPFRVDYGLSPLVVYRTFVKEVMKKSGTMDILCRPWAATEGHDLSGNKERIELPSWMPSLDRKPFKPSNDGKMTRANPDPLVGPPVFRQSYYSASGSQHIRFMMDEEDPNSKQLTIKGFILDTVGQTWDAGAFGNVPESWLRAGNWEDERQRPPGELWRTLVADRNGFGWDHPDRWYPMVLQSAVKELGLQYGLFTHKIISDTSNKAVAEVFKRIQAVIWGRRMFRTHNHYAENVGRLGLAPGQAREGDLIVIIFGCSVPLVLRKLPQTTEPVQPFGQGHFAAPFPAENPVVGDRPVGAAAQSPRPTNTESTTENTNSPASEPPNPRSEPLSAGSSNPAAMPGRYTTKFINGDTVDEDYTEQDGRELYTLVGECYIDELMDGQAMSYYQTGGKQARWFNII